jgi:4-hydroxy-3-polyprenylbenzoate decarboxylase
MVVRSTRQLVEDLRRHGRLIELTEPVSPFLEMAEIQRRVYARGGPAILFSRPLATAFPMVGNLFGSLDQARFIFRRTLDRVRRAIELKIDPMQGWKQPWRYAAIPWTALHMLPKRVATGPVLRHATSLTKLPSLVSWPDDGGPFITLPQVLSQGRGGSRRTASLADINLGMYRVQLSGNDYLPDQEVGLHYQLHRGIGVHHQAALQDGRPFPVTITVGGHPAMTLAAVMPLPEGLSELMFAGALAGHRIPMIVGDGHAPIYADADFVIAGEVCLERLKPEGPFGDHLGYYARQHPFPYLKVRRVAHREGAIWPFTVVGRPPQEDTTFGELIHELTGPIVPTVLPGVKAVHAVDAAGVHPLLLAVGSERYTPYQPSPRPQELLTQAHAILGQGQMSLAKYLMIINHQDAPDLDLHDLTSFFEHFLTRVDWRRDLHFQTQTTIDTLDYSGEGLNQGSKLILAAVGPPRRRLARAVPEAWQLPEGFGPPQVCLPGVWALRGPAKLAASGPEEEEIPADVSRLLAYGESHYPSEYRAAARSPGQGMRRPTSDDPWGGFPLWVIVDDAEFASRQLNNFLWVTFTRSNPASDIYGLFAFQHKKHWGCLGPLIIDARRKPHHAPPLIEDKQVTAKVDAMAARGGPIARYL